MSPQGLPGEADFQFELKRYLTIEIPAKDSSATSLAIGEIVEFATARLRKLSVDPVRMKFHWARSIGDV